MAATKNIIDKEMTGRSATFKRAIRESIDSINEGLRDRPEGCVACSGEWLKEFELLIDSLHKEVFAISEPRNSSPSTHRKLIELRHRLHDLYAAQSSCCH